LFLLVSPIGTGLVISRLNDSIENCWSAPSAIGTVGVSWGALIGVDLTDYVILLNTDESVKAFMTVGQVTVGGGLEVAVGPIGRSGSADLHVSSTGTIAPAYSYSHSRGIFAGVSLDGSVIMTRDNVNYNFYGRQVTPEEILTGHIPPPRAGKPLYHALNEALAAIPDDHSKPPPVMGKLINMTQQYHIAPHVPPPVSSSSSTPSSEYGHSRDS
jgi:lipid-binding SYLF domain-containing protein